LAIIGAVLTLLVNVPRRCHIAHNIIACVSDLGLRSDF